MRDILSILNLPCQEAAEFPPQRRIIKIDLGGKINTFYLPFPYFQFYFFSHLILGSGKLLYVSWSLLPVENNNAITCRPFLPNIASRGVVCLGKDNPKSLKEAITQFWNTTFTSFELTSYISDLLNYFDTGDDREDEYDDEYNVKLIVSALNKWQSKPGNVFNKPLPVTYYYLNFHKIIEQEMRRLINA